MEYIFLTILFFQNPISNCKLIKIPESSGIDFVVESFPQLCIQFRANEFTKHIPVESFFPINGGREREEEGCTMYVKEKGNSLAFFTLEERIWTKFRNKRCTLLIVSNVEAYQLLKWKYSISLNEMDHDKIASCIAESAYPFLEIFWYLFIFFVQQWIVNYFLSLCLGFAQQYLFCCS